MGYGMSAASVKAAIDKRSAQRDLERQQQKDKPKPPAVKKKTEAELAACREYAADHYDLEKLARAIWWGLRTRRLEEYLRRPWRVTT